MAIVINGSGTVTGLAVGGLPDGTVDAGTLATNSVDSAELVDGAVDDSHMASIRGRKNILINGGFDVWQRGTSFTVPDNAVTYTTDRWAIFSNGSNSRVTTKEEAVINNKVGNSIKVALTTPNARDRLFRQKIEDLKQFSSQTLTLSYYAKASTSTEYKVETRRYYGTGGSADSNDEHATHTFTTSWQKFTTTFTVPDITGDTFGANNGLWIMFKVNTVQTHDVYLANVQLERGSTATDFEHRSYGEELALCQRYFEKLGRGGGYAGDRAYNHSSRIVNLPTWATTKRADPTVTIYSGNDAVNAMSGYSSGTDNTVTSLSDPNQYSLGRFITLANSITQPHCGYFHVDAEL